jgi:FkbM family methyltransferase
MTFISYAQNFEDVMLFRALKGVENGFYIDVGAQDPVFDSVTKAFYERGWRGINIEPVEQWFQKLVADRLEDVNLQLAASSQTGKVRFFDVPDTGMSTSDVDFARQHAAQGFEVREYEISAKPLDAICAEFGVQEVHFLKVDVEGAEAEVLRGINLIDIRPWIILVESTEPNSQVTTHENWERLLTNRGYEFIYFDGLNRFYLAREHAEIKNAFSIAPNYFDHFVRYPEWQASEQVSLLEAERAARLREFDGLRGQLRETLSEVNTLYSELEQSRQEADMLRERLAAESRLVAQLNETLDGIHKSLSIRITAPVRAAKRRLTSISPSLRSLIGMPRRALRDIAWRAANQRTIRGLARRLLGPWPRLRWRIKRLLLGAPEGAGQRRSADYHMPPLVVRSFPTTHAPPRIHTLSEQSSPEDLRRFVVIQSRHAVVDTDKLRAKIRHELERCER